VLLPSTALTSVLAKPGKYQPDGISSREAQERYHQIKKHIHQKIKNVPGNKEKFNTAFWDYLDRHVLPPVRESLARRDQPKPASDEEMQEQERLAQWHREQQEMLGMEEETPTRVQAYAI
jgi:hypothetical protein